VHYHNDDGSPRGHLPVRDTQGITPGGQDRIADAFDAWANSLID
jgi:hypothetical protein